MQNWKYTFPPTSREDWIRQIETDLKGKSIESLNGEWWPGEPLVPIHHADDASPLPLALPDQLFASPPHVMESIDIGRQSAEQINQQLLEALEFGTEVFLLRHGGSATLSPDRMLDDVFPEMIQWHVVMDDISHPFYSAFQALVPHTFLRLPRPSGSAGLHTLWPVTEEDKRRHIPFKLEYTFPSEGPWIQLTTGVFKQILSDFNQWIKYREEPILFFEKCILRLEGDAFYFKHIVQTRVLHLLWLNLCRKFTGTTPTEWHYLECHLMPNEKETPEHYLIRASMSSLAACLSGSASICIHHLPNERQGELFKRTDRNIHHLLHLESGLPVGQDPVAGSFALDHYTRSWTERIWHELFEK